MMNFSLLVIIKIYFLAIALHPSQGSDEFCSKPDEGCAEGKINKYSKDYNAKFQKFLQSIKEAKEQYVPCKNTKCSCHADVIVNDLKAFGEGISKKLLDTVKSKGTKYQIIDHHLYREQTCMFPARCAGVEHFLLELLPNLPDTEFILNSRDWPQIHKKYGVFGPVFSFSKTPEYHDILYPAWAFWEGGPAISLYPRGLGRWDQHRNLLGKLGNNTKWEDKIPKAFFRGSRTSAERDPLVLLSREQPGLVDAQYTKNQAWKSDADTLHAPPAKEVSFEEHCKYKYLFNFRGVAGKFSVQTHSLVQIPRFSCW
ncbi:unnamed protein product [Callosobruchus maculatus]|uniref:Glycosyl transferase CAP10 domain-containing protein n=1 Tax=Callosobruchus maculatus TaxID=64391 RepID=A0A653DKZ3_CALMS|nr:unnamed protein product [Callosobruchus maculatus]